MHSTTSRNYCEGLTAFPCHTCVCVCLDNWYIINDDTSLVPRRSPSSVPGNAATTHAHCLPSPAQVCSFSKLDSGNGPETKANYMYMHTLCRTNWSRWHCMGIPVLATLLLVSPSSGHPVTNILIVLLQFELSSGGLSTVARIFNDNSLVYINNIVE